MANATKTISPQEKRKISRRLIVSLSSVATVLLLILSIAVWCNNYIFSTANFTNTAMPALTSESTTKAVADSLSDRLYQDRPVLGQLLNDRTSNLIAALLRTDLSGRAFNRAVTTLQITLTSAHPKDVAIDLTGIKNVIVPVIAIGQQLANQPNPPQITGEQVPDTIVLVDAESIPNFYNFGVVMLWLSPLAALGSLGVVGYLAYRLFKQSFAQAQEVLWVFGGVLLAGGLLGLGIVSLTVTTALGSFENPNVRTVVRNLLDAFMAHLNTQIQLGMIVPAIIVLVAAGALAIWPFVKTYISQQRKPSTPSKKQ